MISGDALLVAIFVVATVNTCRYISTLRSLLVVMRDCDPLLYQQVVGRGFFHRKVTLVNRFAYFITFAVNSIKNITIRFLWRNA